MYDPNDPLLARVREIALAFPEAAEKVSHGHPAFFTKKVFCYFGGSRKVDGEWHQHEQSILFLPEPDERPALEADDRIWVPAYLGGAGWLGLDLDHTDWEEVAELLEDSYRATAQKRLVTVLNDRAASSD